MAETPKQNPSDFKTSAVDEVEAFAGISGVVRKMEADLSALRGAEPFPELAQQARKAIADISALSEMKLSPDVALLGQLAKTSFGPLTQLPGFELSRPLVKIGSEVRPAQEKTGTGLGSTSVRSDNLPISTTAQLAEPIQDRSAQQKKRPVRERPRLNVARINKWMDDEGFTNSTLAEELKISPKAVSSARNNGGYHGRRAVTKLANRMGCEYASDLYLD